MALNDGDMVPCMGSGKLSFTEAKWKAVLWSGKSNFKLSFEVISPVTFGLNWTWISQNPGILNNT